MELRQSVGTVKALFGRGLISEDFSKKFEDEHITIDTATKMDDDDWKTFGVTKFGDRFQIRKAFERIPIPSVANSEQAATPANDWNGTPLTVEETVNAYFQSCTNLLTEKTTTCVASAVDRHSDESSVIYDCASEDWERQSNFTVPPFKLPVSLEKSSKINLAECQYMELKGQSWITSRSNRELKNCVQRTLNSFINMPQGGRVLFGVNDDGEVTGVEIPVSAQEFDPTRRIIDDAIVEFMPQVTPQLQYTVRTIDVTGGTPCGCRLCVIAVSIRDPNLGEVGMYHYKDREKNCLVAYQRIGAESRLVQYHRFVEALKRANFRRKGSGLDPLHIPSADEYSRSKTPNRADLSLDLHSPSCRSHADSCAFYFAEMGCVRNECSQCHHESHAKAYTRIRPKPSLYEDPNFRRLEQTIEELRVYKTPNGLWVSFTNFANQRLFERGDNKSVLFYPLGLARQERKEFKQHLPFNPGTPAMLVLEKYQGMEVFTVKTAGSA